MKISTLVSRVNLHGLTTLGASHPMEAPADGHSVGPVVVTDRIGRVHVTVSEADATELLEMPAGWVRRIWIIVEHQVPVPMPLTLGTLECVVQLETGLLLGKVEEGVWVGVVHVHVSFFIHCVS